MSAAPRTLPTTGWVPGQEAGRHRRIRDDGLVVESDRIIFAGRRFPRVAAPRSGAALRGIRRRRSR